MNRLVTILLTCLAALIPGCMLMSSAKSSSKTTPHRHGKTEAEKERHYNIVDGDTIYLEVAPDQRHGRLTDEDYREVAQELGVEIASIKAVVEIEAGRTHEGFWTEGKPLINFDLTMFRRFAAKNHVNLGKYAQSHAVVFARPNARRYGSQQAGQQARLDAARTIHDLSAIQGTFWGMFQIGGFNWQRCGTTSPDEFVKLMSRSERDQLELFANFIRNSNLLTHLRNKNWSAFANGYNGTSYAARGYHTRLAASYAKHKRSDTKNPTPSTTQN